MVNNGGWIRIVEVFVAILIIISSVLIVLQGKKVQSEQAFCDVLPGIMDEIAKNESMRVLLLSGNSVIAETFAQNKIQNPSFVFKARICEPDDPCLIQNAGLDKVDICAEQRIISTSKNATSFAPKQLKLFLFRV